MNRTEFDGWLEYHCAAFPGVRKALEEDTAGIWFAKLFKDLPANRCYAATDRWLTSEQRPWASEHGPKIAFEVRMEAKAAAAAATPSDTDRAIRRHSMDCRWCRDTGFVLVAMKTPVTQYQPHGGSGATSMLCAMCELGRRRIQATQASASKQCEWWKKQLDQNPAGIVFDSDASRRLTLFDAWKLPLASTQAGVGEQVRVEDLVKHIGELER